MSTKPRTDVCTRRIYMRGGAHVHAWGRASTCAVRALRDDEQYEEPHLLNEIYGPIPPNPLHPEGEPSGDSKGEPMTEKGSKAVSEIEEYEEWLRSLPGPWVRIGLDRGWIRCPQ